MPIKVLMPALSPTMTEGKLAKWIKSEGDQVESGDVIAEIETDKATMEVEAADEGKLAKIIVSEGTDSVAVNDVIAVLLEDDEDESALDGFLSNDNASAEPEEQPEKQDKQPDTKPKSEDKPKSQPQQKSQAKEEDTDRVFASPLARRMAEDAGIDLSAVKGSGPRGRIVKVDIEAAKTGGTGTSVSQGSNQPPQASGPNAKELADILDMAYEEIPNSGMRKTIAKRLLESKQTVPHFYLTIEPRIDKLLALRKEMNEGADGEYKISVNDFIIKACALALMKVPAANAAWTDDAILQFANADISVAVATPDGLVTPIIKEAEGKGLKAISENMKDLAVRARDGKLKPTEYQGGTFTISNLGMFGIQEFSAIINPPQSCILAVGTGVQKPLIENGVVTAGTTMKCTLSCDHRAVDGAVGAEFLQAFQSYIENPMSMLV